MYYKILADGKVWFSKEIVKAHYHVGDDAIQRKVMDGSISSLTVMDRIIYSLPAAEEKKVEKAFSPVIQDLDALIKEFYVPGKEEAACMEHISYDKTEPKFIYSGFEFIKYNAVRSRSKYRDQKYLPVLEVCGVKYVALNTARKGNDYIVC